MLQYSEESGLGRIMRAVLGAAARTGAGDGRVHRAPGVGASNDGAGWRGLAWLPQTLVEDDIGEGRIVRAASHDWEIPL